MDLSEIKKIREKFLAFYEASKRVLPWRRNQDPYAIWVSEIMLQQTQVDTVMKRYDAFLERFPTVQALAEAEELSVCEAWAGLGYYRRARLLHRGARAVVEEYQGVIPGDALTLQTLPGIGRYTAGAIASIAFKQRAPLVDGNVERVLCRIFLIDDAPKSSAGQKKLWALAEALVQGERPGDLNQSLMELGALICTPKQPQCTVCPLRMHCGALANDRVNELPVPNPPPKRQILEVAYLWLSASDGRVYLRQRGLEGLWAGLWEPYSCEGKTAHAELMEQCGCDLVSSGISVSHQLTHRDVRATVYVPTKKKNSLARRLALHAVVDPLAAPLSALARKVVMAQVAAQLAAP